MLVQATNGASMRLLLIEDSEPLSDLVAKGLANSGFDADKAVTAAEARAALTTMRYAAIILDLGLPDADGMTVLRELRARGDPTPVIILTARGRVEDRISGLQAGADDYLGKPFAIEELVARLQALLRRPGHLLGLSLQLGNVSFDTEGRQVTVGDLPRILSPRELAVLEILLRRAGRVVPKTLLEDQLYGLATDIGSNAVEVYVHRLRKQLVEAGADVEIHTIRGVGYLIRPRD
jgi:two-component system response regulator TctD